MRNKVFLFVMLLTVSVDGFSQIGIDLIKSGVQKAKQAKENIKTIKEGLKERNSVSAIVQQVIGSFSYMDPNKSWRCVVLLGGEILDSKEIAYQWYVNDEPILNAISNEFHHIVNIGDSVSVKCRVTYKNTSVDSDIMTTTTINPRYESDYNPVFVYEYTSETCHLSLEKYIKGKLPGFTRNLTEDQIKTLQFIPEDTVISFSFYIKDWLIVKRDQKGDFTILVWNNPRNLSIDQIVELENTRSLGSVLTAVQTQDKNLEEFLGSESDYLPKQYVINKYNVRVSFGKISKDTTFKERYFDEFENKYLGVKGDPIKISNSYSIDKECHFNFDEDHNYFYITGPDFAIGTMHMCDSYSIALLTKGQKRFVKRYINLFDNEIKDKGQLPYIEDSYLNYIGVSNTDNFYEMIKKMSTLSDCNK